MIVAQNISIDMIRLVDTLPNEFMDFLQYKFDQYKVDYKYWTSYKHSNYKHNWSIIQSNEFKPVEEFNGKEYWRNEQEGGYYIGFQHNMNSHYGQKSFVIEYNPNKIRIEGFIKDILTYLFQYQEKTLSINSFDIAFDFKGYNTSQLKYDKKKYKITKEFNYQDNKTIYLGEFDKLYNKGIESNLEYDLLRYEKRVKQKILIDDIKNTDIDVNIPDIFVNRKIIDDDLNDTEKALLFAVNNGYPLNKLSRKYKEKIKKHIGEDMLEINKNDIKKILLRYIRELKSILDIKIITQKEIKVYVKTKEYYKRELEIRESKDKKEIENWKLSKKLE